MLSGVKYANVNDFVPSTLGFTYYSHDRAIINKMHGKPSCNLLVTRVPISRETSNDIFHSHIKIAQFISMILTIFVLTFFINCTDYWIVRYGLSTYVCWCCMN